VADRLLGGFAPYLVLVKSRIRAQRAYPVSFRWDLLGAVVVGMAEFAEVWVVFHNAPRGLGGLDINAILLVFGLSNVAFLGADLLTGDLNTLATYIRAGTLDALYIRPLPLLTQLMTSDFRLRRLAEMGVAVTVLTVGVIRNDLPFTLRTVGLFALTISCGIAIFAGVFVCAAGLQFFVVNGAEMTNSFTYGGAYAASQPASIFPNPLKLFFGYLIPVVFTGYLPTVALLRLPGSPLLPPGLAWFLPVAALSTWALAMATWRAGMRHYQGAGG
jgi:ABC-2 type transport system permease protein